MSKPWWIPLLSLLIALAAGAGTMWIYMRHINEGQPESLFAWLVLSCIGLTVGVVAFFVVWGHFQKTPQPRE